MSEVVKNVRAWIETCEKAGIGVPPQVTTLDAYATLLEANLAHERALAFRWAEQTDKLQAERDSLVDENTAIKTQLSEAKDFVKKYCAPHSQEYALRLEEENKRLEAERDALKADLALCPACSEDWDSRDTVEAENVALKAQCAAYRKALTEIVEEHYLAQRPIDAGDAIAAGRIAEKALAAGEKEGKNGKL